MPKYGANNTRLNCVIFCGTIKLSQEKYYGFGFKGISIYFWFVLALFVYFKAFSNVFGSPTFKHENEDRTAMLVLMKILNKLSQGVEKVG